MLYILFLYDQKDQFPERYERVQDSRLSRQ